ncbi:MAG TPA: replication-associated recombination protein A [Acidimicrobiales bacterium]|nr:replication-associated recombination protein A [Acidimicrobiales bacterium]
MASEDLFSGAAAERVAQRAPLAARLRPHTLDDIIGQRHLVGPGAPLRALIEADRLTSAILWGPPGTGKTTLATVVATATSKHFVPLSAVTAGVKDVREVVEGARRLLGEQGRGTILFLDEVHRFNRSQQDALLPSVEEGLLVLIGATTENPFFEVNAPLLSRSTLWRLEPLTDDDLAAVVARGLAAEGASAEPAAVAALVGLADGDARAVLTTLEVALALAGTRPVALEDVERARHTRLQHYGEDDHYDQVSAFIKSIRGSDPDAGLYWLARMLESGEDARFIARRLVILASEDIGEADPLALVVADAAARAVEFVGLPEAQLNLAQAVVHLACAPKSNRVTVALGRAQRDVREWPRGEVPTHLRDAHYRSAAAIGHGEGYVYPHDEPGAWTPQRYLPDELGDARYYEPSDRGHEAVVADRLRGWREGGPGSSPDDPDDRGSGGGSAEPDPADESPDRK